MIIDIELKFDLNSGELTYGPQNIRIHNLHQLDTFTDTATNQGIILTIAG